MKKITILISTLILTMGLMACGAPADEGKTPDTETPEVSEEESPEGSENESEEDYKAPAVPEIDGPREATNITQDDLKAIYADNQGMLDLSSYFLGMKAPEIKMTSLTEVETSLGEITKENTIVEFMASWCSVCTAVKPILEDYKSQENSVNLISISIFDDATAIRAFAGEDADDYYELADEDKTADDYLLRFVPIFFFVDSDGIIQFVYSGDVSVETLNQYAEKAFGTVSE